MKSLRFLLSEAPACLKYSVIPSGCLTKYFLPNLYKPRILCLNRLKWLRNLSPIDFHSQWACAFLDNILLLNKDSVKPVPVEINFPIDLVNPGFLMQSLKLSSRKKKSIKKKLWNQKRAERRENSGACSKHSREEC